MSNIYKKGLLLLFLFVLTVQFAGCAHQAKARRGRGVFPGEYKIRTIVVDPGHGGKDPGAIGVGRLKEKDVVLDISKRFKKRLERAGLKVILTRDRDVFLSLKQRARIANTKEADFFISIHANAFRKSRAAGFEVYYLSEAIDDSARAVAAAENAVLKFEQSEDFSKPLRATLWDILYTEHRTESIELARSICKAVERKGLSRNNRGVKGANFCVLRSTKMPAVLVEVGFISNPLEASRLKLRSYRQKLAEAIAEGVLSYKRSYEASNGFTK